MSATREVREELALRYEAALELYAARRDEEALNAAYELGREALAAGFGVLDLASFHRAVITGNLRDGPAGALGYFEAAEDFFREALSPFEMAFRGYIEVNAELHRMNHALVREREAALAANKELEAFSYSVSHDLRAPLRAIAGFSRIIEEDSADHMTPDDLKHLSRIQHNVARMAQLIDDLLALSRVARAQLVRARVDLSTLAHRVAERLRIADPKRDVALVVESPLVVEADAGLLMIVLENLIGNAWKFTSKRPRARIELGRIATPAKPSVYYVRDDGAGFDMSHATKLFGAFQRLHSANDFEGTGIGLATVQRIVERHGGRVWAEAIPNRGATFYFTLGEESAA
jgi:light-regulated signal transduction histidine kinase (bacteriophytochrome)